jgi:phosphatidyl-myo-inositol dimannoside synthase
VIVHPGCDVSHYRPTTPRTGLRERLLGGRIGPMLLTVGNLVERKGHDTVLKALPAILRSIPDVMYLIIGDGPYRTDLERLAESLGVRGNVVFAGRVEADILPECLAVCDVFVMTSRARLDLCDVEGFGLVYLEAMPVANRSLAVARAASLMPSSTSSAACSSIHSTRTTSRRRRSGC